MKQFKKKFRLNNDDKFVNFIGNVIDGYLQGDWNEYEVGEEVVYSINIKEEFEDGSINFGDINPDSLFEFVGEGICLVEGNDDNIWYNVKVKDDELLISYEYLDEEEDY